MFFKIAMSRMEIKIKRHYIFTFFLSLKQTGCYIKCIPELSNALTFYMSDTEINNSDADNLNLALALNFYYFLV